MLAGWARSARAWAGLARSLRIYHGDRRHLAGLETMYRPFVRPGGLVFDVGAHVGDRTRIFARLGARVVAVEPQPRAARFLRFAFRNRPEVRIVEAAVAAEAGVVRMHINVANPTVSTLSDALLGAAPRDANWAGQRWEETVDVPAITLDRLIEECGRPDFLKIDVEGFEDVALMGLSALVPAMSFEFTTLQRDVGLRALERAAALGFRRFNLSLGESHAMHFPEPVEADTVARLIAELPNEANSGDVYCLADGEAPAATR